MRKIFTLFSLLVILIVPVNAVSAQEITYSNDITQSEIDRRMEVVLDYLNEHSNDVVSDNQDSLNFDIPVDEGVVVTVKASHKAETKMNARISSGQDYANVQPNSQYTFTLDIKNLIGSNDITTFEVTYNTTNARANGTHDLSVIYLSSYGQIGGLYAVKSSQMKTVSGNNTTSVDMSGYVTYDGLFGDKTVSLNNLKMTSFAANRVNYMYNYGLR